MGSVLVSCADRAAVPAGGALAVDRGKFSQEVEAEVESRPLIEVVREEAVDIPNGPVVIAAGPLCSPSLSQRVLSLVGGDALSFFDAAAPLSMRLRWIWTFCLPSLATGRRGRETTSTHR